MNWKNPDWKYVPVKAMKPNYLAEKFKKIRAEQRKEAQSKVTQFPERRKDAVR